MGGTFRRSGLNGNLDGRRLQGRFAPRVLLLAPQFVTTRLGTTIKTRSTPGYAAVHQLAVVHWMGTCTRMYALLRIRPLMFTGRVQ